MDTFRNVYDPIARHARQEPDRVAVHLPRRVVTFGELDRMSARAASAILRAGLAPGDRAGIMTARPLLHLVTMLALARLQVAHVALSLADPPLLRNRIAHDLGLAAVVGEEPLADASMIAPDPSWLDGRRSVDSLSVSAQQGLGFLILKSSGTTGEAKYAELSHDQALQRYERYVKAYGNGPDDVFWPLSAIEFVAPKQRMIFNLQAGAALCIPFGMTKIPDVLAFVRSKSVTIAMATPAHLELLLHGARGAPMIPTLRIFEVSTATVTEQLRRRFRKLFSERLYINYGTNESAAIAIAPPGLQLSVPDTVGHIAPGIALEVVDRQDRPLPRGEVGEVRVRAPGIVTSYIGNQAASEKAFRDGWFYPGDLASLSPDGSLLLHGRADDMMICDGVNIYPREIESVLLEHEAVREAAAFPVASAIHQQLPCAAVTVSRPTEMPELDAHCRARLGFKSPRRILIMKELPRNAMNKVLTRELLKLVGQVPG